MNSKLVSRGHTITFRRTLLKEDKFNQIVMEVWEYKAKLPTIVQAFSVHSQKNCLFLEKNGDNNYLTEKLVMNFGVKYN